MCMNLDMQTFIEHEHTHARTHTRMLMHTHTGSRIVVYLHIFPKLWHICMYLIAKGKEPFQLFSLYLSSCPWPAVRQTRREDVEPGADRQRAVRLSLRRALVLCGHQ